MKKQDDVLLIAAFLALWFWMKRPKGEAEAIVKSSGGRYYSDASGYVYYQDTDGRTYIVDQDGNRSPLTSR